MEQLHCVMNCIIDIISSKFDYRPFLFGSWDMPVTYTEEGYITYFSYSISSKKYFDDFRNLYGDTVCIWYENGSSKYQNLQLLKLQLNHQSEQQCILVQVDLFYLFYEKSSYQRKHQPHFIIINSYTENGWNINDPYYLWEGIIPDDEFILAFTKNIYGGGATIDLGCAKEASNESIAQQFEANFELSEYPLIDALKLYIRELIEDRKPFDLKILESVISQFTVLYKTKISYSYVYSYFAQYLSESVQSQTEQVNKLLKNWNTLMFLMMKSCMTNNKEHLPSLLKKIDCLYEQEKEIKAGLWSIYECWKRKQAC